jgi:mannosyltransferase
MTDVALPPPDRPKHGSARPLLARLVALFLTGLIASLVGSWRPSLWTDEAATVSAASRTLAELLAMVHNVDAVHATYYAFMHCWLLLFPPNAFFLRLPSGIAVGFTTVGVYLIGRRLTEGQPGQRTALLGAIGFALLPRTTWMGMEARPYALSARLAVASTYALLADLSASAGRRRRLGLGIVYTILAALGIAVNIFLVLLLIAHGISLLLSGNPNWRRLLRWLAGSLIAVLLTSPILWTATHQTGQLGGGVFGPFRWVRNVVVNQWFLGETPTPSTGSAAFRLSPELWWQLGSIALALVCWLLVAAAVLSRGRSLPLLLWTLPWLAVPTLVIGGYSVAIHNMYNARYFSFTTPALALLIGHGLHLLKRPWLRVVAVVLVGLFTCPVWLSQRTPYAKSSTDWSGVARFVAAHRGANEAVYFSPRYPIVGPVVTQTARGVETAYPAAFVGMRDVTLLRTPVEDNNLSGTSTLLEDSLPRMRGVRAVWVVRRLDYAYSAQDDQTLAAAGYLPGLRWTGPLDTVVEFSRR